MARKQSRSGASKGDKLKHALRDFVRSRGADYLRDPNVTSIGVGRKNGDGEVCLVFSVRVKREGSALEALGTTELPASIQIDGIAVPTDVIERNYEPSYGVIAPQNLNRRRQRQNPIQPGISVSHINGSAGTLGGIVYDADTGAPCILSNWHVLHGSDGAIGDAIVQPGPFDDNNTGENRCGTLLRSHLGAAGDCALARVAGRGIKHEIYGLGTAAARMAEVDLDDKVIKSGRTTAVTHGIVRRIHVMTEIDYAGMGMRKIGGFEIGIDPDHMPSNGEISMGGDSGSFWMIAENGKATDILAGLHFAGESSTNPDEHALACYPNSVRKKLRFDLAPPAISAASGIVEEEVQYRTGYDHRFLGVDAPMPKVSGDIERDCVKYGGRIHIPYAHFSVCLSKSRRLARFVAWNIDGAHKVVLGDHGFRTDDRIADRHQVDNVLYCDNFLDRGHIARRADLAWGPIDEAKQANKDSFHYTNIAPQHERFNRSSLNGIWGDLENLILTQADAQDIRVSVVGGPLFRDNDPKHRGIKIPREFWKLIVYRARDGHLTSAAFVLSQTDLLSSMEALDLEPFKLHQVSIDDLECRTGLDFSAYSASDALVHPQRVTRHSPAGHEAESVATSGREIRSAEQLVF